MMLCILPPRTMPTAAAASASVGTSTIVQPPRVEARLVGHRADARRATDEDRFDDLLPFGIHRPFERMGFIGPDHGRGDRGNVPGAGDQAFEFPVAELAARNVCFRCIVSVAGQIGPLACRYSRGLYVGWRVF